MSKCFLWLALVAMVVSGCKKDTGGSPTPDNSLNDEVINKTREYYLWNNQIPANFDAASFDGPEEIMDAVTRFSIEPGFVDPVDHFSFAMKKADWDKISTGVTTDFGLNVFFMNETDLRVRAVEKASPAGIAGIRRGWRITAVDGNTNISTDNAEAIAGKIYNSPKTELTFELPDGSEKTVSLIATTYQEEPLYLDTIYTEGSRKVGYLVFNSFLGRINDVKTSFARVFSRFVANGVRDVVVDLRYNGGGYVSLQESLANYLITSTANGQIMMKEEFNAQHSAENVTIKFEKIGTFDPEKVYFIVGENTASASELLINNLKPYMNVKLVGQPTYGKPVGFFDIQVQDWLIFPVSFRSTNSRGEGNYFDGIGVDKFAPDGLDKDWGDRNESALSSVLGHIRTGSFGYVPQGPSLNSTLENDMKAYNKRLNPRAFRGAILDRR